MVVLHSYGKNCTSLPNAADMFDACEPEECVKAGLAVAGCEGTVACRVGENGRILDSSGSVAREWADSDAAACPDRLDCPRMNLDFVVGFTFALGART